MEDLSLKSVDWLSRSNHLAISEHAAHLSHPARDHIVGSPGLRMKGEPLSNLVGRVDVAAAGRSGADSRPLYQRIVQELQSEIVLGRYP